MQETKTISVLIERAGDWWVAQCLQHDLATQARTISELHYEIQRLLIAHIVACEHQGIEPFQIPPAPREFWAKYEATQIATSIAAGAHTPSIKTKHQQPKVETRLAD